MKKNNQKPVTLKIENLRTLTAEETEAISGGAACSPTYAAATGVRRAGNILPGDNVAYNYSFYNNF